MIDFLYHFLGALAFSAICITAVVLGPDAGFWLLATLNAIVWFEREWQQERVKRRGRDAPWRWSQQKMFEALIPSLAGFLLATWAAVIW